MKKTERRCKNDVERGREWRKKKEKGEEKIKREKGGGKRKYFAGNTRHTICTKLENMMEEIGRAHV